jgi:hypothetical protein
LLLTNNLQSSFFINSFNYLQIIPINRAIVCYSYNHTNKDSVEFTQSNMDTTLCSFHLALQKGIGVYHYLPA